MREDVPVLLRLLRRMARVARAAGCTEISWHLPNGDAPAIRPHDRLGAGARIAWSVGQRGGPALAALADGRGHA